MTPDEEDESWADEQPQLIGTITQLTDEKMRVPKKQPIGFDLRAKPRHRVKVIARRVC